MEFSYSMIFCWDPDAEMPFDVFGKDELPAEIQSWLNKDIAELRFNKFLIPNFGIEKDFSLFSKIQSGTTKARRIEERDRLNDMYFRCLDGGESMAKSYRQLTVMSSATLLAEGTPKRRTRNSQASKFN